MYLNLYYQIIHLRQFAIRKKLHHILRKARTSRFTEISLYPFVISFTLRVHLILCFTHLMSLVLNFTFPLRLQLEPILPRL